MPFRFLKDSVRRKQTRQFLILTGLRGREARRTSLAWTWASSVRELLRAEPHLRTAEVYRRMRLLGYPGGRSSIYPLVALCRLRSDFSKR
jgi:hypothetical protein